MLLAKRQQGAIAINLCGYEIDMFLQFGLNRAAQGIKANLHSFSPRQFQCGNNICVPCYDNQ